ncbi:MAG: hypothetical protein J2P54_20030 [Bradyrhizobiaceae bacterium]|nr:hypothetical protein [Bradyrhizobiaceae bacterium]
MPMHLVERDLPASISQKNTIVASWAHEETAQLLVGATKTTMGEVVAERELGRAVERTAVSSATTRLAQEHLKEHRT